MLQQLSSWHGFQTLACPDVAPVMYTLFHPDSYLPTAEALLSLMTAMLNRIIFFLPLLFPRIVALECFFCSSVATWAWLGRATSWQDGKQSSRSAGPALAPAQTMPVINDPSPACRPREQAYISAPKSFHPKRVDLCFVITVLYTKWGC